jgi:hypothetical protein
MAPYMIHTSFQHELYQLNVPPVPNNYRQTHSTAASTINTDAPRALETEDEEPIIVLARNSLWNIRANSRLRERIPQNEGTHSLRTEADVLDASRLYLLHPVNVAVNELLKNGRLECRREHVASSTSRTDILWVHIHNDQTTNIAVLEFKNAFVLRKADFSPAMVNASEAERAVAKTFAGDTETLLTGNAYWLSKQAVKYHEELQTADVAIFDWNNMVVFDFSGMSETPQNPKLARAIWFSEAGKNHNQHQTFRALLLGFLIRALRRSNLVN